MGANLGALLSNGHAVMPLPQAPSGADLLSLGPDLLSAARYTMAEATQRHGEALATQRASLDARTAEARATMQTLRIQLSPLGYTTPFLSDAGLSRAAGGGKQPTVTIPKVHVAAAGLVTAAVQALSSPGPRLDPHLVRVAAAAVAASGAATHVPTPVAAADSPPSGTSLPLTAPSGTVAADAATHAAAAAVGSEAAAAVGCSAGWAATAEAAAWAAAGAAW